MSCCKGNVCASPATAPSSNAVPAATASDIREVVKNYYGKVLTKTSDLQMPGCCMGEAPHPVIRDCLKRVPVEVTEKYYGCGSTLPLGIDGLTVLDLGSGSGQDAYVASQLVGSSGFVIGVDMTTEQLDVARSHSRKYCASLGYPQPNMQFLLGFIENLEGAGVQPGAVDLAVSNCVINLCPDKQKVLAGVHTALKEGGELYFSDVYCNRRLPDAVRTHPTLVGECIGGALYTNDFIRICHDVGFANPRIVSARHFAVDRSDLGKLVGEAQFYSITYRCFKLSALERTAEDYGQVATYKGGIQGSEQVYALDESHVFEQGRPALVSGNTAAILSQTRLAPFFTVTAAQTHFGRFVEPAGSLGL